MKDLINICGFIEISLFTNVITKVIIASENGIRVISKSWKIFLIK